MRRVLDLQSLLAIGATLNLLLSKIVCSEPNFTFPLLLGPPGKGLPDGVSFSNSKICIPRGIPSNLNTLIQYTAMDGDTASTTGKATSLDHIVVRDSFFQRTMSRTLYLASASKLF